MKTPLRSALAAIVAVVLSAVAAPGQPAVTSPEVLPDGRVTFRVLAPQAQAVAMKGLRGLPPQAMTKSGDGVWEVTVGPLAPDLYSYTFDVDGATFTDPRNRRLKEWLNQESLVEVPGRVDPPIGRQDVPHGGVHRHLVPSAVRGGDVAFQVYTPPGLDPAKTYPVLYLLHGYGDEETAWLAVGRAHFIADNLLAQGKVGPAVIVMTNGHPVPLPGYNRVPDYGRRNHEAMERELLTVVRPFVEANYPVRRDAAGRAIVGLSMGGGHALGIGLNHPELFGWVGGFSSGVDAAGNDEQFAALLAARAAGGPRPALVWIACGKDDFLIERNRAFVAWLQERKIDHEWHLTEGAHEWPVWRDYLAQFLQRIFR